MFSRHSSKHIDLAQFAYQPRALDFRDEAFVQLLSDMRVRIQNLSFDADRTREILPQAGDRFTSLVTNEILNWRHHLHSLADLHSQALTIFGTRMLIDTNVQIAPDDVCEVLSKSHVMSLLCDADTAILERLMRERSFLQIDWPRGTVTVSPYDTNPSECSVQISGRSFDLAVRRYLPWFGRSINAPGLKLVLQHATQALAFVRGLAANDMATFVHAYERSR